MKKLIQMTVSMLKIGLIGFGGGNALIPVIQKEIVEEKGLITREEYEKDIVAAALTPGALPVEIAAGVGKNVAGKKGNDFGSSCHGISRRGFDDFDDGRDGWVK